MKEGKKLEKEKPRNAAESVLTKGKTNPFVGMKKERLKAEGKK